MYDAVDLLHITAVNIEAPVGAVCVVLDPGIRILTSHRPD
jgi:hypothetical protein